MAFFMVLNFLISHFKNSFLINTFAKDALYILASSMSNDFNVFSNTSLKYLVLSLDVIFLNFSLATLFNYKSM